MSHQAPSPESAGRSSSEPVAQPTFRWNAGGWFGGQIGGTLWLGLLGTLILEADPLAGLAALAGFAVMNAFGWALWIRRGLLDPYVSLQVFLALCALATTLVFLFLRTRPAAVSYGGLPGWVLLVFPLIMLTLHLRRPRSS